MMAKKPPTWSLEIQVQLLERSENSRVSATLVVSDHQGPVAPSLHHSRTHRSPRKSRQLVTHDHLGLHRHRYTHMLMFRKEKIPIKIQIEPTAQGSALYFSPPHSLLPPGNEAVAILSTEHNESG